MAEGVWMVYYADKYDGFVDSIFSDEASALRRAVGRGVVLGFRVSFVEYGADVDELVHPREG